MASVIGDDVSSGKVVTAGEMLQIEKAWFDSGEITLECLMERVGKSIAEWVLADLDMEPGLAKAVALVGKGNNGGDALVAAKHLALAGVSCVACLCLSRGDIGDDYVRMDAVEAGVRELDLSGDGALEELGRLCAGADVIIDGVLGFSVSGAIREPLTSIFEAVSRSGSRVVAVDMPSGAGPDDGVADPNTLAADVTLSVGMHKLGPAIRFGDACYGERMEVLDYGMPSRFNSHIRREVIDGRLARSLLPRRSRVGHKGSFGRTLIVAGSKNYVGAAALATRACLRSGAGLVTLASVASVCNASASVAPEATYIPFAADGDNEVDTRAAFEDLKWRIGHFDSVLIGPGLGQSRGSRELMRLLLSDGDVWSGRSVVLDADGLNIASGLDGWWRGLGDDLVITPHPGEMSRLLGVEIADIERDPVGAVESAAAKFGCVAILKGAVTLVSDREGRTRIGMMPNDGMSRGGTGDVLAGLVAGLSNGMASFDAASLGVYVHGVAGLEARGRYTAYAMTAGDVVDSLSVAFEGLGV